jgi:hypothetical protein
MGGVHVVVGIKVGMTKVGVSVAGSGLGVAVGNGFRLRHPARSVAMTAVTRNMQMADTRAPIAIVGLVREGFRRAGMTALAGTGFPSDESS